MTFFLKEKKFHIVKFAIMAAIGNCLKQVGTCFKIEVKIEVALLAILNSSNATSIFNI